MVRSQSIMPERLLTQDELALRRDMMRDMMRDMRDKRDKSVTQTTKKSVTNVTNVYEYIVMSRLMSCHATLSKFGWCKHGR